MIYEFFYENFGDIFLGLVLFIDNYVKGTKYNI